MKKSVSFIFILMLSLPTFANPTKEFITSCTYGVLTGTLVGVASLAFTDQPGDNLQNVARGASLGLYLGVALGIYVIYVVPGQGEDEFNPEDISHLPLQLLPIINDAGIDGLYAQWTVAKF